MLGKKERRPKTTMRVIGALQLGGWALWWRHLRPTVAALHAIATWLHAPVLCAAIGSSLCCQDFTGTGLVGPRPTSGTGIDESI